MEPSTQDSPTRSTSRLCDVSDYENREAQWEPCGKFALVHNHLDVGRPWRLQTPEAIEGAWAEWNACGDAEAQQREPQWLQEAHLSDSASPRDVFCRLLRRHLARIRTLNNARANQGLPPLAPPPADGVLPHGDAARARDRRARGLGAPTNPTPPPPRVAALQN